MLGSFTTQYNCGLFVQYNVVPDQDYIDSLSSVDAGISWGSGTLGLADTVMSFTDWTVTCDRVGICPSPSTLALAPMLGVFATRRRRAA